MATSAKQKHCCTSALFWLLLSCKRITHPICRNQSVLARQRTTTTLPSRPITLYIVHSLPSTWRIKNPMYRNSSRLSLRHSKPTLLLQLIYKVQCLWFNIWLQHSITATYLCDIVSPQRSCNIASLQQSIAAMFRRYIVSLQRSCNIASLQHSITAMCVCNIASPGFRQTQVPFLTLYFKCIFC